ncbi:MAG TPA: Nif3-like dinuclear metal center hexameric protein [Pseudomonadales bacterium]|jgi:dinuclear metal center YbgI/SA1388 family protein
MTVVTRDRVLAEANALLQPDDFEDYCPNGLQVEGKADIRLLVSGVTASQRLIEQAIACGADAIVVHHGYFWKGDSPVLTGMLRQRIGLLLQHNISLLAYHLPLDAHATLGNNAMLARQLGIEQAAPVAEGRLLWSGVLQRPCDSAALSAHLERALQRRPLHFGEGPQSIRRVAWCTGAAQGYLSDAVKAGVDAYITGEASEQTVHEAREQGIHCFAAGHHATERYGVKALGDALANALGIRHQFLDCDNPV